MNSSIKFTDWLSRIIVLIFTPLKLLNLFGLCISSIWLGYFWQWHFLFIAGIIFCFSSIIISIALVIEQILVMLLMRIFALICPNRSGEELFRLTAFLNMLFIYALITSWCLAVLIKLPLLAGSKTLLPALIFSYCVAIEPWVSRAQREIMDNNYTFISILFTEISCVISVIMLLFNVSVFNVILIFGIIMFIAYLVSFSIAKRIDGFPVRSY